MCLRENVIYSIRYKDGDQESYPVLERVVLVEAFDAEEARHKVAAEAKQKQDKFTGTYCWGGGRPVDLEFIGVSKAACVSTVDGGSEVLLSEGQELTCWEYEARCLDDVKSLVSGGRPETKYIE